MKSFITLGSDLLILSYSFSTKTSLADSNYSMTPDKEFMYDFLIILPKISTERHLRIHVGYRSYITIIKELSGNERRE